MCGLVFAVLYCGKEASKGAVLYAACYSFFLKYKDFRDFLCAPDLHMAAALDEKQQSSDASASVQCVRPFCIADYMEQAL